MPAPTLDPEAHRRATTSFAEAGQRLRQSLIRRCGEVVVTSGEVRVVAPAEAAGLPAPLSGWFEGGAIAYVEPGVVHRLVGRVLGEVEPDPVDADRELTPLDRRLARRFLADLGAALGAWGGEPGQGSPAPGEPQVECTFTIGGGPVDPWGAARVWIPKSLFAPAQTRTRAVQMERVLPLSVDVRVEFARLKLPLARLRDLAVGSEIELGRPREVKLTVGGKNAFVAEPGEQDGWRCVRVRSRIV